MTDQYDEITPPGPVDAPAAMDRRRFLRGLGKWSQAVIGGVLLGGAFADSREANAWVAARGYGGSAAAGVGGGWVNRYGGGGGWINGGGGWINRYGGGGSAWVNRY
jgi:hypothetical protein